MELHFHALPGVDDGSATIDASVDLLRAAVVEGTGTVVTTHTSARTFSPTIAEGLVRAVSSDAHGPSRPPLLGEARARLIEGRVPPAVCKGLTAGCPRRLLARGVPSAALHVA